MSLKLLVCDDVIYMRAMLRKSLEELGHSNIHEAEDGQDALEKINKASDEKEPFDLVFIDWNMPRMTGIEVVNLCRASAENQSLPFVMISAERDHENIVTALKAGVTDYILKPFSTAILKKKIEKILAGRGAA